MYGHVAQLAEAVKSGIESAGHSPTIYQIEETLSDEALTKMDAPPKPAYPIIYPEQLPEFDAFMLGIPTRFGNFPGQWKVSASGFPPPSGCGRGPCIKASSNRSSGTKPANCGIMVSSTARS